MKYGASFNGRRIIHPGAYDNIDATAMVISSPGSLNLPVVIGTADAGEPGVVKWFTSPESAQKYLRGGDLHLAANLMFSPSSKGGGGCSTLGVIVANRHERATLTSGDIIVTSREYGEGGNNVLFSIEPGTIEGAKKVTISRWDIDTLEVFEDVGYLFSVTYEGAKAVAELSIVHERNMPTKLEIKLGTTQEDKAVDLTIDLSNGKYPTIGSICQYISSIRGYRATLANGMVSALPSSILDACATVNIKTPAPVLGVKGDLLNIVNQQSELVELKCNGVVADIVPTHLTGGVKGSAPASWSTYFEKLKKEFSDILVVLSADVSIQMEASSHVGNMETRGQKQMLFTGGDIGETVKDIKQRAATLNTSRAVCGYPGILIKSGNYSRLLPSYFTGALLAGRVSGVPHSEPITFDPVGILGLEKDFIAGDPEVDDLLSSGVCTLERVTTGGFRIAQGITTYTSDNNILYREISVRRNADNISSKITRNLEDEFTGKKGLRASILSIRNKAIEILDKAVAEGDLVSYKQVRVKFSGTVAEVEYEAAPVTPINFILLTSRFVPTEIEM